MQIIILAGGLAKRLRPITKTTPKALINIKSLPFIEYQLRYLENQGVSSVILCLGYLGEKIIKYISSQNYNFEIKFSHDGKELLGTGGAIKKAINLLDDEFLVMYGDSFLPIDFYPVFDKFAKSTKSALMTLIKNNNKWDKSNVVFKKNKIELYDKLNYRNDMNYIDYGLSVFKKKVFLNIDEKNFDLAITFKKLSLLNELDSFCVESRFYEIGSKKGIEDFEKFIHETYN